LINSRRIRLSVYAVFCAPLGGNDSAFKARVKTLGDYPDLYELTWSQNFFLLNSEEPLRVVFNRVQSVAGDFGVVAVTKIDKPEDFMHNDFELTNSNYIYFPPLRPQP
jgi:hypothetical protein